MQPVAMRRRLIASGRSQQRGRLDIISVHSGAGAGDRRTELGPAALADFGFRQGLADRDVAPRWFDVCVGDARMPKNDLPALQDCFSTVVSTAEHTAGRCRMSVAGGQRFLVLGGDHSISIGTWSGAANALRADEQHGPHAEIGLIWIDAHMDAHTPLTSPSGNWHGMAVAHLLGYGDCDLLSLSPARPAVRPENLCLIGTRSFEAEETELLQRLGVRVISIEATNEMGFDAALREGRRIACSGTAGYGISLDLDVVDPRQAPGVGTPVDGGIPAGKLVEQLRGCLRAPEVLGLEIVEYNPARDVEFKTARFARDLVTAAISGS